MLAKDYSASLGRTRSVLGNLLLLWFVASWAVDRLDMDLCSLHSWCPEAEGAFCLEAAGLSRSLGAMEKLPCGSQVSGGCDLHADEGMLAVGASLSCPREPGLSPGKVSL